MRNSVLLRILFVVTLFCVGAVYAQDRPVTDVNPDRHPNLAEAQRLCVQAWDKLSEAQHANDWDMHNHAQHAKELLDQASREIGEAARDANHPEHDRH